MSNDEVEPKPLAFTEIPKIVDEIAETESAQAADSSYLDDLELVLGDLEVGSGESDAEVIENLDELGLSGDDLAAHRIAKKNKAKIDQHPPKAEISVATLPAAASATEPVDLKRPDPVAEHLGELDASAEAAVESAIARSEAYEDRPVEPTARTVEIRKYLAKLPKRGAARTAACEEFGVDPTDPLAVEKVKVAYTLKKFKATLTDLESFWPGYWGLPYRTLGKDDKGEPFPSRALVLKKFEWRRYNEITSAERKKLKESARLKKREAKIRAKGWPANFYDLSPADQKRERDRVWRQNKRTS